MSTNVYQKEAVQSIKGRLSKSLAFLEQLHRYSLIKSDDYRETKATMLAAYDRLLRNTNQLG